jgi:hypothetical protein
VNDKCGGGRGGNGAGGGGNGGGGGVGRSKGVRQDERKGDLSVSFAVAARDRDHLSYTEGEWRAKQGYSTQLSRSTLDPHLRFTSRP